MSHEIAQASPAVGLRAVHCAAHPGGTQAQQRLRCLAVVARDERHGGNGGKLAYEARDTGQRLAVTAMHGNDHGVYAPAARDVQRFSQRIGMQGVEAAVTRGVDARALRRRKNCAHGHHAPP